MCDGSFHCISCCNRMVLTRRVELDGSSSAAAAGSTHSFGFDSVIDPSSSQEHVFQGGRVADMIQAVLEGFVLSDLHVIKFDMIGVEIVLT